MKGNFEIGIFNTKIEQNLGTLWRSAYQLGAQGVFTIGKRYKYQSSDTVKVHRHIPVRHYETFDQFVENLQPTRLQTSLIGIEMGGQPLSSFSHPHTAIYLLGAEDHGLPQDILDQCDGVVSLESVRINSYNVAVAGSIVMYSRAFID